MTTTQRLLVTPAGHGTSVWQSLLQDARRVAVDRLVAAVAPTAGRRPLGLLLASAHPDDETLGGGRLAHAWSTAVGPVIGVLSTLGEACVDHVMTRPPGMAERRLAEWQLATSRLGFSAGHVLGLPDGQLKTRSTELVDRLRTVITGYADDHDLVLAAPWRGDPHPDHQAVGHATATVAAELGLPMIEYPVWMTYWSTPQALHATHQELVIMNSDATADAAHQYATDAFVSQLEPLAPDMTPVVPAAMLEHHRQQLVIMDPEAAGRLGP